MRFNIKTLSQIEGIIKVSRGIIYELYAIAIRANSTYYNIY